jgi:EmrB/QacA subfamily drug resistance transporter
MMNYVTLRGGIMSIAVSPAQATVPDERRWKALSLVALADFVVILDATIVNIALPSIGRHFHASITELSWVVSAYILAFGGLLMLGGRLADLFGRRRMFVAGLVIFGVASLAGGLSSSIGELIAFRALQGLGAAALAPAARSIVQVLFEEGAERSKAMGIWAAVAGSGTVVGLILGGVLTSEFGWQWVLWVNVPVTLGAAVLAYRLISESRAQLDDRSIDVAGAALVGGGLVATLYALVNANSAGWASLHTLGLLGLGAALLASFVWVESKVTAPLMPLHIFRLPQVRGANIAMVLTAAAMVGMFFVLSLYQQQLEGYSALAAGLSALPLAVVLVAVAGAAGPLTERMGPKPVLLSGLALFTSGVAWLSRIPVHGSYVANLLGPDVIIGLGLGLTFVSITIASTLGVSNDRAGLAGGLINTTQQIGGAIGLAVITTVAASHTSAVQSAATVDGGFRAGLLVAAGVGAVATIAAMWFPRRQAPKADPVAAETDTVRQASATLQIPAPAAA